MHLTMLLDMAADAFGDRPAVGRRDSALTYGQLREHARRAATWITGKGVEQAAFVDINSDLVPTLLYGAAYAGVPFVPVNYRLDDDHLRQILARTAPSVAVVEPVVVDRIGQADGVELVTGDDMRAQALALQETLEPVGGGSPEDIAILLFTSGTTGDPKAAILRHRHLVSYIIGTVEFMGADESEATLVSVPPYHVAGTTAVLSSCYAGRRIVYLPAFTPEDWVTTARDEAITHAMVVPTMLMRILDVLEAQGESLPALGHLSYGGGRMPAPVIERALTLLPHVDFVNAYGLTETSSTVAMLSPEDHREALASDDPVVRRRLGSVGRPLPNLTVEVRDPDGKPVPAGVPGEIWVQGEQVAGEYLGRAEGLTDGWFRTNDGGSLDEAGYLFLDGRLDDVIVRGAENLSPGEIEDVLASHPAVAEAVVVGIPDVEWGEKVVAAVVLVQGAEADEEELRGWVRDHLRSSKTPEHVQVVTELPYNEMGKLLRRVLRQELARRFGAEVG